MKLTSKKIIGIMAVAIVLTMVSGANVVAQNIVGSGCPKIEARATDIGSPNLDTTLHCGDCVILKALSNATATTANDYTVMSIPYNPPFPFVGGGLRLVNLTGDDYYADTINLPFDFCFYGNTYHTVVVGTNGIVTFDLNQAGQWCPYSFYTGCPIPNVNFEPDARNAIYGVYEDIYPGANGGAIYMGVVGEYPCRAACFSFYRCPLFGNTDSTNTSMIVMYEGTNIIDVYIENHTAFGSTNNGEALVGIQNATGTFGLAPAGRNGGHWRCTREAWRFTPTGTPNYRVTWYQGADTTGRQLFSEVINSDTAISRWRVCPVEPTDYTARMEYVACNGDYFDISSSVHINADTIKREYYDTCSDSPIEFGGVMRYYAGVYYDTVHRRANYRCDSIIRQLTLGRVTHSWDSVIACGRYVWRDGRTYNRSTILPTYKTTNEAGCDSIIHLHLTMDYKFQDTIVDTICEGQQSFLFGNAYSRTGRYVDTMISQYGCDSIKMLDLTVIPKPIITLHNTGFDCETQTFALLVHTTDDSMFHWTSSPYDLSLVGQERDTLIHVSPFTPTYYTVSAGLVTFNPECETRVSIFVEPSPKLEARIHRTPDYVLSYNTQMRFDDVSLGHVVQRWWTCERKDYIDTNSYTYYNYPREQDSTWVKLVVRNEYLCYDSTIMYISVNYNNNDTIVGNRDALWLPNAFSPDLPTNKYFMAKGVGILEYHITLYNRFGQKVFESDDINEKWDGTYNGQVCQAGVYSYVLRFRGQSQADTELTRKGSVLLVR
ncbi:MAG: gliding motility-associated C-terminal domain-containing protein [Bacteroidales bacterium]|nr:gliding motility-associated C-terminal domain-containing protein [Bacteroidales bacterium]